MERVFLTNRVIRNYLQLFNENKWKEVIKYTLIYGIQSLQSNYNLSSLSPQKLEDLLMKNNLVLTVLDDDHHLIAVDHRLKSIKANVDHLNYEMGIPTNEDRGFYAPATQNRVYPPPPPSTKAQIIRGSDDEFDQVIKVGSPTTDQQQQQLQQHPKKFMDFLGEPNNIQSATNPLDDDTSYTNPDWFTHHEAIPAVARLSLPRSGQLKHSPATRDQQTRKASPKPKSKPKTPITASNVYYGQKSGGGGVRNFTKLPTNPPSKINAESKIKEQVQADRQSFTRNKNKSRANEEGFDDRDHQSEERSATGSGGDGGGDDDGGGDGGGGGSQSVSPSGQHYAGSQPLANFKTNSHTNSDIVEWVTLEGETEHTAAHHNSPPTIHKHTHSHSHKYHLSKGSLKNQDLPVVPNDDRFGWDFDSITSQSGSDTHHKSRSKKGSTPSPSSNTQPDRKAAPSGSVLYGNMLSGARNTSSPPGNSSSPSGSAKNKSVAVETTGNSTTINYLVDGGVGDSDVNLDLSDDFSKGLEVWKGDALEIAARLKKAEDERRELHERLLAGTFEATRTRVQQQKIQQQLEQRVVSPLGSM